jgi:hypothetical protein
VGRAAKPGADIALFALLPVLPLLLALLLALLLPALHCCCLRLLPSWLQVQVRLLHTHPMTCTRRILPGPSIAVLIPAPEHYACAELRCLHQYPASLLPFTPTLACTHPRLPCCLSAAPPLLLHCSFPPHPPQTATATTHLCWSLT